MLLNRLSLSIECAIRFDGPKEDILATLPLVTWNNLINFPLGNEINPPKLHFKWPSSRPERKKLVKKISRDSKKYDCNIFRQKSRVGKMDFGHVVKPRGHTQAATWS